MNRSVLRGSVFAICVAAILLVVAFWYTSIPTLKRSTQKSNVIQATIPAPALQAYTPSSTSNMGPQEVAHVSTLPLRDPAPAPGETAVRVPILMYHRIRPVNAEMSQEDQLMSVSPEVFERQMQELVNGGYQTISPSQLYTALESGSALPAKSVMITFDDGFESQYREAFPLLKKYHLQGAFLIISGYSNVPDYMSAAMIKEIDASGYATIVAHTRKHPDLSTLSPEQQTDEIVGSKQDLEKRLGHPVDYFGYPYGAVTSTSRDIIQHAGFRLAFGTLLGSLQTSSIRYDLRRITVTDKDSLAAMLPYFSQHD